MFIGVDNSRTCMKKFQNISSCMHNMSQIFGFFDKNVSKYPHVYGQGSISL